MRRIRSAAVQHRAGERSLFGKTAARRAARGLDRSERPHAPAYGRDDETIFFSRAKKLDLARFIIRTLH